MDDIPKILAAFLLLLFSLSTCSASLSQFAGDWSNADPNTGGMTRLSISVSGASANVQAWGKCHPTDCDWGMVQAYVFAPDVSSDPVNQAQALMAVFNSGFSVTTLFIKPQGNSLSVQSYTAFQDSSARSNYASSYTFTRTATTQMSASGLLAEVAPLQKFGKLQATLGNIGEI